MSIRFIASVVIAALLMTGGAVTASQVTEYGVQPAQEAMQQNIQPVAEKQEVQTAVPEALTAGEAKVIALEHAGLKADEVTELRAEYDVERATPQWEVDFRSGDWEYDYEINAVTGEVLKHKKEYDPVKTTAAAEKPVETTPPETQPKPKKLTADEAKAIALQHAGLTADQVKGLRAEYDMDDGVPEWEVEFFSGGMEYDYEIHAETGKIISWDKERDD